MKQTVFPIDIIFALGFLLGLLFGYVNSLLE